MRLYLCTNDNRHVAEPGQESGLWTSVKVLKISNKRERETVFAESGSEASSLATEALLYDRTVENSSCQQPRR